MTAGRHRLPEPLLDSGCSVEDALRRRRSVREYSDRDVPLRAAAQLLWAAQGITSGDGGRTAPSAGALYPLTLYFAAGRVADLAPGLYRYAPREHALRLHRSGDLRGDIAKAALDQGWISSSAGIVLIACVLGRTAARYGPRAERYVYLEAGHAAQNVCLEAASLGLVTVVVGAFDDDELSSAAHLPRDARPVVLLPFGHADD